MIGQLPPRLRPLGFKRRCTLPYTHRRAVTRSGREERANGSHTRDTDFVLFDPPRELPTATVVIEPRTFTQLLSSGIALWLSDRWRWLRPRTIPLTVALVGLLGVVRAVDYLTHLPTPSPTSSIASSGGVNEPR